MVLKKRAFIFPLIVILGVSCIYYILISNQADNLVVSGITGNVPFQTQDQSEIVVPEEVVEVDSNNIFINAEEVSTEHSFFDEDSGVSLVISKSSEDFQDRFLGVLITKPEITSPNVPSLPVKWAFNLKVNQDLGDLGYEVRMQFEDSRFISVIKTDTPEGSVRVGITPRKIVGDSSNIIDNILSLGRLSEKSEISLDSEGEYLIRFSTTPVIQTEKVDSEGKTITLINVAPVNYNKVSVVTKITQFGVRSVSDLKISDREGNILEAIPYDTDGNGILDYARFDVSMDSEGLDYDVSYVDSTRRLSNLADDSEPIEVELSPECKQSMNCYDFNPCDDRYGDSNNYFIDDLFIDGEQERICVNDINSECYPAVRQVRECSLSENIEGFPVFVSKGLTDEAKEGEVLIEDSSTGEPLAILSLRESAEGNKLDIVFVQSEVSTEEHCYNALLDADSGEEEIDCGGDCKQCLEQGTDYFTFISFILWIVFSLGVFLFFLSNKVFRKTT